ncbi:hypothetical protein CASFOL_006396 [Castilleja foliolosa]|uniref:F-box domain-containing protein n=1 Tax=Castilleja foliolosa TaxID=1961234 RepID=A0ABD3E694_9LAMI
MDSDDDCKLCWDMIFEILTRTSLRTLDTCKCVSKKWNNLVYESSFTPLYYNRTNNVSGYIINKLTRRYDHSIYVLVTMPPDHPDDKTTGNKIDNYFPENMNILASCNQGLLCCEKHYYKTSYYVGKPTTRQWQALPNPKLRFITLGFAIMVLGSAPLRFKIIRLSYEPNHKLRWPGMYALRCEIFDSKSWCWSWKQTGLHLRCFDYSHPAVCVGKSVYWLTDGDNVVSFHEPDESFEKFSLPQVVNKSRINSCRLVNYKGTLGMTRLPEERDKVMELWLRCNNNGWTLEMAVSNSCLRRSCYPPDFYDAAGRIVFIKTCKEAMFCKLEDAGSVRKVDLDQADRICKQYFQYRSDWEPVDLRGRW